MGKVATVTDEAELYSKARVPLEAGVFDISVYVLQPSGQEAVLVSQGLPGDGSPPFVRIHSECFTGEALGSLKCDCRYQLQAALESIAKLGYGAVVYLRQEGRGIGLGNKIRAYDLQDRDGLDTIAANEAIGFPTDLRKFDAAAIILAKLGIDKVRLNTNNPQKIEELQSLGIEVVDIIPSLSPVNPHNESYLQTKKKSLGHLISFEERPPLPQGTPDDQSDRKKR